MAVPSSGCQLIRRQIVEQPLQDVFAFFSQPENLKLLTPSSLDFTVLTPAPVQMKEGALIDYTIRLLGIRVRWTTKIIEYKPPHFFSDEQLKGPYAYWRHTHSFQEVNGGTEIMDRIDYKVPFGFIGTLARHLYVKRNLEHIFNYRAKIIQKIFD